MELFEHLKAKDFVQKVLLYKREVLSGIGLLLFLICGWWGYGIYQVRSQRQAHKAYIEAKKYFDAPVLSAGEEKPADQVISFSSEQEKWEKVEQVFREGYQHHKNAGIGPMFLVIVAEALQQQGKFSQAREALAECLPQIQSATLKVFYEIKHALMLLDSDDERQKKEGLATLNSIAQNAQSPAHDVALYYLGEYYWASKDFAQAKGSWGQLAQKYGPGTKEPSPWYDEVKDRLKLIASV